MVRQIMSKEVYDTIEHADGTQETLLIGHRGPKAGTRRRAFQCSFCSKAFSCVSKLRRHSTKHTGSKPYSCPRCNHRFTQQPSLRVHMATVNCPQLSTTSTNNSASNATSPLEAEDYAMDSEEVPPPVPLVSGTSIPIDTIDFESPHPNLTNGDANNVHCKLEPMPSLPPLAPKQFHVLAASLAATSDSLLPTTGELQLHMQPSAVPWTPTTGTSTSNVGGHGGFTTLQMTPNQDQPLPTSASSSLFVDLDTDPTPAMKRVCEVAMAPHHALLGSSASHGVEATISRAGKSQTAHMAASTNPLVDEGLSYLDMLADTNIDPAVLPSDNSAEWESILGLHTTEDPTQQP
eukprot:m.20689 g.20689  ORF g.20689 m.20689 type:complete len:348 (-) comp11043_c0_seq1:581-1624(-)